jgi:hypothetical protein
MILPESKSNGIAGLRHGVETVNGSISKRKTSRRFNAERRCSDYKGGADVVEET